MDKETLKLDCGPLLRVLQGLAREGGVERAGLVFGERLGGTYRCIALFMVRNISSMPSVSFTMDPWETVVAHVAAEKYGLELVAVYHTHPCGPPRPSPVDERYMRLWPVPWIIASPGGLGAWTLGPAGPVRVGLR